MNRKKNMATIEIGPHQSEANVQIFQLEAFLCNDYQNSQSPPMRFGVRNPAGNQIINEPQSEMNEMNYLNYRSNSKNPIQAHKPYVGRQYSQCRFVDQNQNRDEYERAMEVLNINSNQARPQNMGQRPKNCRTYRRLADVSSEDVSCNLNIDRFFSQFQIYCKDNIPTAKEQMDRMKWPLLTRFFDNVEIPGYAVHIRQNITGGGRYVGESYWIGWTIPYWMNLPVFLLSDDEKRKLTLFWIARQRRFNDLHQYRKLSVLLCTYYPSEIQFKTRRGRLDQSYNTERSLYQEDPEGYRDTYGRSELPEEDEVKLWALQPQLNPNDDSPTFEEYESMNSVYDPFMYVINGGKGADLARNKNLGLSVILNNNKQRGIAFDSWLIQRFPKSALSDDQETYVWDDMYTNNRNNDDILDLFLSDHEAEISQIFYNYYNRLRNFLNFGNFGLLGRNQMGSPNVEEERSDQLERLAELLYGQDFQDLSDTAREALETWIDIQHQRIENIQSNNNLSADEAINYLADRETQILMYSILQQSIKENLYRYNSNNDATIFPKHST